jgi:hypothetical protein
VAKLSAAIHNKLVEHFGWKDGAGESLNEATNRVDIDGMCYVLEDIKWLGNFPVAFGNISKDFSCGYIHLTTLENGPLSVEGDFDCQGNELTSLQHAPAIVNGFFDCSSNKLTTLAGAPPVVGNHFACWDNQLTSLKGGPNFVLGNYICSGNKLTNLVGMADQVGGWLDCTGNPLQSFEGLSPNVHSICITWEPHLPLLRLAALREVEITRNEHVDSIFKKHQSADKATLRQRILLLQLELIECGFAANARW